MAKINILPAKVYNRIAAGEVIDRPYSVVKELVENSIDACASKIDIYIEQGGKQLIRVVDDGFGIERDDLQSAFLPHATSKISKASDLETVRTLGFRGEAIASIASVSKMTIASKTSWSKHCYKLSSNGGELGEIVETAGDNGTDVSVEMLFYNTPVRLTFLKSDKAEESEITNYVSKFILNRTDIAFTYYVNGKKVLQSFGGGLDETIAGVYGPNILDNCYRIDALKYGVHIKGYIGNQNFSKPNKSYQSVFLNGRYITNATISAAMSNAYASYLMKRQYPFYVLYIYIPPEIVDVNVHPNKSDVRFSDNQVVYGCIYTVVSAVLDGQKKALDYIVDKINLRPNPALHMAYPNKLVNFGEVVIPERGVEEAKKEDDTQAQNAGVTSSTKANASLDIPMLTYEEAQKEIEACTPIVSKKTQEDAQESQPLKGFIPIDQIGEYTPPERIAEPQKRRGKKTKHGAEKLQKKYPDLYFQRHVFEVNDPMYEAAKQNGTEQDFFAENKRYLEELDRKSKQNKIDVNTCVYVGKLFNTYLMYERNNDVYIIDQHAAHERLIFDRLKEKMETRTIVQQPMLLPYKLDLNAFESAFIAEHLEEIREMGFEIEEFGDNSFKVSAIPLDLQHIDLASFFNDILGDISGYRSIKLKDLLKDKLASAACKAAVKGGMDLTREEIDALFVMMDGDMGLKCPHGRPVVVKLSRTELEKMFKRIV